MSLLPGSAAGPTPTVPHVDLNKYLSRLKILFASAPFTSSEPIVHLPERGSSAELKLFCSFALEIRSHTARVRRSAITSTVEDETQSKIAAIALTVFQCPPDLDEAVYRLALLAGRMVTTFREWRMSWPPEHHADPGILGEWPIERFKRLALLNLSRSSDDEAEWLDILIRACGDLPELWDLEPSSSSSPARTSDFMEDGNSVNTHISSADSFQTSQTRPPSMRDVPGQFDIPRSEVDPPGTSAMYHGDISSAPFLDQSVSNPVAAAYQGNHSSSHSHPVPSGSNSLQGAVYRETGSLPHPSFSNPAPSEYKASHPHSSQFNPTDTVYEREFGSSNSLPQFFPNPNPAFGVFYGDVSGSHSLPNLSSGATSQGLHPGGVDGSWSGYNAGPLGRHEDISGSDSIQHQNLQHGLYPSIPKTAVNGTPSNFLPNSVASEMPMPSAPAPVAMSMATASRQAIGSTFRRSSTQSRNMLLRDAIALENAKTATLSGRCRLLRLRTKCLPEYSELIQNSMKLFYDGSYRVHASDYLGLPLHQEHREALLECPEHIAQLMTRLYLEWKQDMEI